MKKLLYKIRKSHDEDDEETMANHVIVLGAVVEHQRMYTNQPRACGSHVGCAKQGEIQGRARQGNDGRLLHPSLGI